MFHGLIWGLCVSAGIFGWGAIFLRALRLHVLPIPIAGAVGTGVLVLLAGPLNLAHWLVSPALQTIVVTGDVFLGIELVLRREELRSDSVLLISGIKNRPVVAAVAVCLFSIMAMLAVSTLRQQLFAQYDDLPAYFVFPVKTLSLGTIPYDPFSERRIMSSLGANYFLQALMLPGGDWRSIAFVDSGFGRLLFISSIYVLGRSFLLSRARALTLAMVAALAPLLNVNLQMYFLPAALFAFAASLMLRVRGWRLGLLLGITGAAVTAMKGSYLPAVLVIFAIYFLFRVRNELRDTWAACLAFSLMLLGSLVPWMIDSRAKTGTYFYPLLGKGFHATAFHTFAATDLHPLNIYTLAAILFFAVPVLCLLVLIVRARDVPLTGSRELACIAAFLAGSSITAAAIGYGTAGDSVARYCLPFGYAGLFGAGAWLLRKIETRRTSRSVWMAGAAAVGWMLFLQVYYGAIPVYGDYRAEIQELTAMLTSRSPHLPEDSNKFVMTDALLDGRRAESQIVQSAVPAGEPILALLMDTSGFDFRRNTVYVIDMPGMAGLPPGMPGDDPFALRRYLLSHDIHFIAYPEDYDETPLVEGLKHSSPRRVLLTREARASVLTMESMRHIEEGSPVLFRDGHTSVFQVTP